MQEVHAQRLFESWNDYISVVPNENLLCVFKLKNIYDSNDTQNFHLLGFTVWILTAVNVRLHE